ncbi:MAG TPA: NAD(P)H-dependent oxidoreductase [Elusimicrobiota bacterium]|nr:NAD(P)H-dependent oxidoreductase [Elusimicrobiota bacterium]
MQKKISVIVAHPNPKSFNHAIAGQAAATLRQLGHAVFYHDLYREKFDPLFGVGELQSSGPIPRAIGLYCREALESDGFVVVHPNWWAQPPAVLKGWVDRVLRQGLAYRFTDEGKVVGLLKAPTAVVFNTANTPEEAEREMFGDPLDGLWKKCIFEFCGVKNVHREVYRPVIVSSAIQRAQWLASAREVVAACFPA